MSERAVRKATFSCLFYVILSGCGAVRAPIPLASTCPNESSSASQLRLTSTPNATMTAGLGYLDIHSTDKAGNAVSRRCTASLWPSDSGITEVDVYTSGHCFFEPDSEEYKNSKFVLQVAYNGGYFPVEAKMPIQEVFGSFSRSLMQFKKALPSKLKKRLNEAIGSEMLAECQKGTQTFAEELGDKRKTIACFDKNESRSVHFVLTPRAEHKEWLELVFEASRTNIKNAFSLIPEREQKIIQLRLDSKKYKNTLEHNLKEFAYLINEKHCTTDKAAMTAAAFTEPQTQALCEFRSQIRAALPGILKDSYAIIEPIADVKNQTIDELMSLNNEVFSCRFTSLEDLNVDVVTSMKTACEVEKLSRLIWDQWVASGPDNMVAQLSLDKAKVSNAGFSVFSLKTNSLDSADSVDFERVEKSRPVVSEISESKGHISGEGLNKQAIMFNFDPENNKLFLMKKDSGSALNLLNIFPLATLTTLDGNPTSGGASVLPLPPVQDDPEVSVCQ